MLFRSEIVDGLPPGHHFLLTGLASVGRGTMAGTDPLAGRATRLALHPFTGLEAQGPSDSETPSLIDILFDADLTAAEAPSTGTDDLRARLQTGGLPTFALPLLPLSRAAWQNRVQADTLAILGDRVLPTETLNTGIARGVLDSVLHTPGGQINRTRIAQELDLDARTVGRYLARYCLFSFLYPKRRPQSGDNSHVRHARCPAQALRLPQLRPRR